MIDRERWDRQFREGGWDFLKSEFELPRYGVLSSYLISLGRPISLLDVGCGEGLMLRFCDRSWLTKYWGLDPSQTALGRIGSLLPEDRVVCSVLEEFRTDERFDVVLFNEVLYYADNPGSHLDRYRQYLNPEGHFLISTSRKSGWFARNSRSIRSAWRTIGKLGWKKLDQVLVQDHKRGVSWQISLAQPEELPRTGDRG